MKRIKIIIASLTILISFSASGLAAAQVTLPAPARVVAATGHDDACNGLNQLGGTSCGGQGQNAIANVAKTVVNIISLITGIAAVIMIVIAGVRFVTSGGESNAVSGAKNALVYAIIGLVIVALAQLIVHFVLNAILTGNTSTGVG